MRSRSSVTLRSGSASEAGTWSRSSVGSVTASRSCAGSPSMPCADSAATSSRVAIHYQAVMSVQLPYRRRHSDRACTAETDIDQKNQGRKRRRQFTKMGEDQCLFFFQAEDGIRDLTVTRVQTCALPI